MAAEMDFGVNDPGNENTSFKIDDLSRFRGHFSLADSDDLFPVYGNKSFNNLSLSHDLTVLEQNLDLLHCCSPKFTLIPSRYSLQIPPSQAPVLWNCHRIPRAYDPRSCPKESLLLSPPDHSAEPKESFYRNNLEF